MKSNIIDYDAELWGDAMFLIYAYREGEEDPIEQRAKDKNDAYSQINRLAKSKRYSSIELYKWYDNVIMWGEKPYEVFELEDLEDLLEGL